MSLTFPYTISPLGDTALLLNFGNSINEEINDYVLRLFHHFKSKNIIGLLDIVPAYGSLGFHYNVLVVRKAVKDRTAFDVMKELVEKELGEIEREELKQQRKIRIPVCYSQRFATDIDWIATEKNISVENIIRLHTGQSYRVYMLGFLPGFTYMGEVDENIAVPRKQTPRAYVPAGAVGIAGRQTGIYPLDSPGGWQIIGRTPVKIFDKEKSNPVLLQPGDQVEFYSITEDEFKNY